jgi:hypothetical protein
VGAVQSENCAILAETRSATDARDAANGCSGADERAGLAAAAPQNHAILAETPGAARGPQPVEPRRSRRERRAEERRLAKEKRVA